MAELLKEDILLANKIASRIKELRILDSGDKQIDFANKHAIDKQLISRWESQITIDIITNKVKGRGITIYTLKKFCRMIGITLKEFFNSEIFD